MIRALGKIVRINGQAELTRHDYYLPLCDILLDLVEEDSRGRDAVRLSHIVHSLEQDILSMAILAGQLLWYEGVTPDRSRSADLLPIGVAAESYLMFLRTAWDVLAAAFSHFAVPPQKRGMIPSNSFDSLLTWTKKHEHEIYAPFRFVTEYEASFKTLKGIRDELMHRGLNVVSSVQQP
jgi:hypothetical protein